MARFRRESDYADGRHPSQVEPGSAEEDASRRDFTVNGLFYDPVEEKLIDYVGGRADMDRRVIKTIGDPERRFQEDKLRLLRAVRFAATLDFEIEPATWDVLSRHSAEITAVSDERIGEEMTRLLIGGKAGKGLRLLREAGLLEVILPEVASMAGVPQPPQFHPEGDVFTHTALMLDALTQPTVALAYAVLLHDVGKPSTLREEDRIRFPSHDRAGSEMAEEICRRMRLPAVQRKRIVHMVANHMRWMAAEKMRESKIRRLLESETAEEELELHRLDCLASHGKLDVWEFCRGKREGYLKEPPPPRRLIKGQDLIKLGYEPGPLFKEILESVADAALERRLETKEEAVEWVKERFPLDGAGRTKERRTG